MGSSYGRQVLESVSTSPQVTADGQPIQKVGGITLDWGTVAAVSADTDFGGGVIVPNGEKAVRFGQILCAIGGAEVQTVEFTGGPTTGSAILTLPESATGAGDAQTTAAISATASAAAFESALMALSRIGPEGVSVARSGAGSAGSPYVFTVTFARRLGDVPQLTSTNTFGGGTTPSVTHGTTTAGAGTGLYGPYDPNATDGRASLSRGDCYITNETKREIDPHSNHPPVIDGGICWKQRIIMTSGAHSLAQGPTISEFETAFPRVAYAQS